MTANLDSDYTYNGEGEMLTMSYPSTMSNLTSSPGASYTYSYDSMYRLSGMTDSNHNTIVSGVTYNAANQMLTGVDTRTYNVLGQLTSISSGSYENLTYNYPSGTNNGKVSSLYNAISGETVTYTYDSLNRLLTANGSGWGQQYGFDSFGNLLSKTVTAGSGPSLSQAVNPANNQIVGAGYDANGNTGGATNGGVAYGLGYDPENRMVLAMQSGYQGPYVDYYYDAQNHRIWSWSGAVDAYSNTTNYTVNIYSPGGQKLGAYLIAPAFIQDSQTEFQVVPSMQVTLSSSDTYFGSRRLGVMDQLGSTSTFYPWGEAKGTNPQNTWNFATYWQDSTTGLDYANNRYYSNAYGRFMTPDPSASSQDPKTPQSWNRYPYVLGDPVNSNDPTGLDGFDDGGDGVCPNIALAECGGFDPNMPGLPIPPGASYPISFPTSVTYPVNGGFGDTGSLTVNLTNGSFDFQFADTQDAAILLGACAAQPELCVVVIGGAVTIYVAATYGPALFEAVNNAIHSSNNRRQNRQFAAAVRSYERQCGQQLTQDQERALHDAITGEGLSFDQIIELAKQMFGCPGGSSN